MFIRKNFLLIVILLSVVFAVAMKATVFQKDPAPQPVPAPAESAEFRRYWCAGQAELNRYTIHRTGAVADNLEQAVLIFGVEDFRTDTQVKSAAAASHDKSIPVLKTTVIDKLITGPGAYSVFTSVFTPINAAVFPTTLKVSSSAQTWEGTTYTQVNFRNNGYQVSGHSYVENEADEDYRLDKVMLEDELYNRIRLNPAKLPIGSAPFIPGAASVRWLHTKLEPQPVAVTLQSVKGSDWFGTAANALATADSLQTYTLTYTEDARKLTIAFHKLFPHQIMGWEETYEDAGKKRTTKATLTKTVRSDYRKLTILADSLLRNE